MDISNTKRVEKTTDKKQVEFLCDGRYFVFPFTAEELGEIFEGFPDSPYCVLYTEIKADKGVSYPEESFYGVPFDNGNIGYQGCNFYSSYEDAKQAFYNICNYTPMVGVIGYCDVYLIKRADDVEKEISAPSKRNFGHIGVIK